MVAPLSARHHRPPPPRVQMRELSRSVAKPHRLVAMSSIKKRSRSANQTATEEELNEALQQ